MAYTGGKSSLLRALGALGRAIIPKLDATYDVGSVSKRFAGLYAVIAVLTSMVIGSVLINQAETGELEINTSVNINGSITLTDMLANHSIILYEGDTLCLNGTSCLAYIKYNGTCIVSSNGACI